MDQQSAQDTGVGSDREHFIPVRKIDIIEALIVHVRATVRTMTGVDLLPEVEIIGEALQ